MRYIALALVAFTVPAMAGFLPKIGQHVVTHPVAVICPSRSVLNEIIKASEESDALKHQDGLKANALGHRIERLMGYCMTPMQPQKAVVVGRDLRDSLYKLRFAPGADYWVSRHNFKVDHGR